MDRNVIIGAIGSSFSHKIFPSVGSALASLRIRIQIQLFISMDLDPDPGSQTNPDLGLIFKSPKV
jgi:hypothetical protein